MSKMSSLADEIETLYFVERMSVDRISQALEVDEQLVRDCVRYAEHQLFEGIPPADYPTEEEIEQMAREYGY